MGQLWGCGLARRGSIGAKEGSNHLLMLCYKYLWPAMDQMGLNHASLLRLFHVITLIEQYPVSVPLSKHGFARIANLLGLQ